MAYRKSNFLEEIKCNCQELLQLLEQYEQDSETLCLKEIQAVLKNSEADDFEAIEEIVCILNKYGQNTGTRHDFG